MKNVDFFSPFFPFFPSFFPLKKQKAKQGMSLGGDKNELSLAIERVELLQLCFTSPLVYFLLIIFPGGKESSQSSCFADGTSRVCYLLLGRQSATMPKLLKASKAAAASWRSWQAACRSKSRTSYRGSPWDESGFPLLSFFLLHT